MVHTALTALLAALLAIATATAWELCQLMCAKRMLDRRTVASSVATAIAAAAVSATRIVVAATATASGETAAAATTTCALRGLVDADGTTVESAHQVSLNAWQRRLRAKASCVRWHSLDFIHASNGSFGLTVGLETNESEATAAAGIAVLNHNLGGGQLSSLTLQQCATRDTYSLLDDAKLLELCAESVVICVPGKAAALCQWRSVSDWNFMNNTR